MDPMSAILCLTKHRDLKHLGVKPYQRFPPNQAANPIAAVAMQPTRFLLKRSVWKGKLYPILSFNPHFEPANNLFQGPTSSRKSSAKHLQGKAWNLSQESNTANTTRNSLPIVRPEAGKKVPPIRTQARSATILPSFVGLKFQVYNGKVYHDVEIKEEMVGHKLGEFSPTRKPFIWDK